MASTPEPPATRVVGIGASAGGLSALEDFLGRVPLQSGLAYVVVQHLDPTHKALLAELLQRVTKMPVREVTRNLSVEPDCVYVIPPNAEMSLAKGMLRLKSPVEPRGLRLPINALFSSLAGDQGERAIAVVLSGMGSDGTAGLQAVKAAGGLTVVQQPETAQFDMMPRSAIAAGCGDIVAPPEDLPASILAYVAKVSEPGRASQKAARHGMALTLMEDIFGLLQARTRHDFSLYKPSTLHRRIERRMAIHGIESMAEYTKFLRRNSQELDLLFKELLIGVTSFFRDPAVWEYLAKVALPQLLERRGAERKLRAWCVGCSTGEEAYSLAIVFSEVAGHLTPPHSFSLQIFASDLSPDAIATARRGRYPATIASDVSKERLAQFFTRHEDAYQINQNIRDMVLFAQHDVVLDSPFTKLDLIVCRNLLIYFDSTLQRKLLPLFHYSLLPFGLLLLGTSETVGKFNAQFASIGERKLRLYQRQDSGPAVAPVFLMNSPGRPPKSSTESPLSSPPPPNPSTDGLQAAADQVLLQLYAPAAVVLSPGGDIVYICGRTGKYLEPAAGKANWNFHAMVQDGLREPLADALKKASAQREPVHLHGLRVPVHGTTQFVDVMVQALHEPAALSGMTLVVFRDVAPAPATRRGRRAKGEDVAHALELQRLGDEIQTLREESRASREELQSANEELQSTNEELQSTNEELTTSKEEMQSMNEELQTINTELQNKLDDLALAQSDMQNLLNSTEIAILFLDRNLNVRRYTERASKIINVRESDIGRPLSDLTTCLQYPSLHEDAIETLRTMAFSEKQIPTSDARWFSVRILPYRRLDNVIDGVVITLVDITATKKLESALRGQSP
jgi:two-component system CheB/CheR fusion protein